MPDDNENTGKTGPVQARKPPHPNPPKHDDNRYFSSGEVADLTLARVRSARLTAQELKSVQGVGEGKIPYAKNILRGAAEEENRLSPQVRDDEGRIIDVDRIRDTLVSAVQYESSAQFRHPEGGGPFRLFALMLYCGPPVSRRFLLSNAPLSSLGAISSAPEGGAGFYSCITGRCSITLAGRPGSPRYIYLATKEAEDIMSSLCSSHPVASDGHGRPCPPSAEIDLPVAVVRQEDPFGFSPRNPSTRVRKEDAAPGLINTLGIRPEDLRKAKKVDNPNAMKLFDGYEVVLTQPGVEGMRLIVTPKHPSSLVDLGARQIGYIDPSKFMEAITRSGKKVFYILVRPEVGRPTAFSLERLDDSCQILGGEEKPATKPASAPEAESCRQPAFATQDAPAERPGYAPRQDEKPQAMDGGRPHVLVIKEISATDGPGAATQEPSRPPSIPPAAAIPIDYIHDAVREHARAIAGEAGGIQEEAVFGDSIAVLVKRGPRLYLMTDGNWDEARAIMEGRLSSPECRAMLTEVISGFGKKFLKLETGDSITITTRLVGISMRPGYGSGEGQSDTLEMIPREVLARAGVATSTAGVPGPEARPADASPASAQEDPMAARRKALTISLLRSANLYMPASYFLDEEMEKSIDEKSRLLSEIPGLIASARAFEVFGGWYIHIRTVEGREYALFRFPSAPSEISEDILSMPAATVFTSSHQHRVSYVLIEMKFLTPSLTEMMLNCWRG